MSITDSEIMGGVGFGDETYDFYNHAEDISRLIDEGRRKTDPFDQMLSGEEISYIDGNPRIEPAYKVYGGPNNPGPYSNTPEELDNGDMVQKYLLNRMPAARLPPSAGMANRLAAIDPLKFNHFGTVGGAPPTSKKGIIERMENSVEEKLGQHTISMLITFIFVLIIAIVVMQIMHERKIYKMMKAVLKSINKHD